MNARIFVLMAAAALMLVIAGASLMMAKRGASSADLSVLVPDQGWEGTTVPEFDLVDQSGNSTDESLFAGEVTILDFIFTNCPLQCPAMTSILTGINAQTEGSGLRFVSMSIDPSHDTPAAMAEHADRFGIDLGRWKLLTESLDEGAAPSDTARLLLRDGLGFAVRDNDEVEPIALAGGRSMSNILHPGTFFLIGPDRQVLGTYSYNHPEQIEDLVGRAMLAAKIVAGSRR